MTDLETLRAMFDRTGVGYRVGALDLVPHYAVE